MSRLHDYKKSVRGALLLLFVVAIAGPWTYTLDGVPPPEWCVGRSDVVLLSENRCASLVSGATMLAWAPQFAAGIVHDLANPRTLLNAASVTAIYLLFVLPVVSSLLVLLRDDSRRLQRFYLVSLIFAALFGSLLPVLFKQTGITVLPRFWGMWLYAAVAWAALAVELLVWRHPPAQLRRLPAAGAGPLSDAVARPVPDKDRQEQASLPAQPSS